jgi:hypothetical protein
MSTPPRENQNVAKGEPPGSPFVIDTVNDFLFRMRSFFPFTLVAHREEELFAISVFS